MVWRIQRREDGHAGEAVRPVLVVLTTFVEDDFTLILEFRRGERRQQIAHAIGFHPEREIERVGGHDLPVIRAVGIRRSVQRSARFLERLEVPFVVVLRALEHQVLEEMRKARPPRLLVLRSDVIPDVDRYDRAVVVLMDENVEAIRQRVSRIRDVQGRHDQIVPRRDCPQALLLFHRGSERCQIIEPRCPIVCSC